MKILDVFIGENLYYDPEKKEFKAILKYGKLKNKTVLDFGAGIGRLSFPISRYARRVIALDNNTRFKEYFKNKENKKVRFVNKRAEHYLKKKRTFDVIILAWPELNFRFIDLIKKSMHEKSVLIFITCNDNSDFESIIDKLDIFKKSYFEKSILKKKQFIESLKNEFKVSVKKRIRTRYVYPNEKIAFRILKKSVQVWYNLKLSNKLERRLERIIKRHKKGRNIIFGEEIFFYVLNKK